MNDAVTPSRGHTPSMSCVVPAYNEAGNLPALLQALTTTLQAMTPRWEIIVVDDGSRDATAQVMQPWLREPGVRYLALSRNFGKEAALSAGLEHAAGEVVVMLDADGQHPLSLLQAMLDGWRQGADAVCAVRENRADESWAKRAGTALFYRIVNAGSPVPIPEDAGDFRLMDRRVVDALLSLPERNRFLKCASAARFGPEQLLVHAPAGFGSDWRHGLLEPALAAVERPGRPDSGVRHRLRWLDHS